MLRPLSMTRTGSSARDRSPPHVRAIARCLLGCGASVRCCGSVWNPRAAMAQGFCARYNEPGSRCSRSPPQIGRTAGGGARMTTWMPRTRPMPSAQARRTLRYKSTAKILPPSLRQIKKGKGGRRLRRPQRAHPAATVADFLTAVLTCLSAPHAHPGVEPDRQRATALERFPRHRARTGGASMAR